MQHIKDIMVTLNVLMARIEATGTGYYAASDMAHTLSRELFRKAVTNIDTDTGEQNEEN